MTITTTPPDVRPARRVTRAVVLFLLVLPGLAWAVIRLFGWERGHLVQLVAFTPYAALWAWVPVVAALAARKWLVSAIAVVAAAMLAVCVLPRAVPDTVRGPSGGVPLTVMTINMYAGAADPAAVVDLVRAHDVAVLAVQELTPASRAALAAAGLDALLPWGAVADEPGTTGSGLFSRFPMTAQGSQRGRGGNLQAYATVRPDGAAPVAVESAHPLAPYAPAVLPDWRADLAAQPAPDPAGAPRILLGDFNATLDHAPMRRLVARGYRDAADALGRGLQPTWGPYDGAPVPPVTLDHVLVDRRIGVRDVRVRSVARGDHRSIIAVVTVPAA